MQTKSTTPQLPPLNTREGEKHLYKLVKAKHKKTKDIENFLGINDPEGKLLTNGKLVLNRWREYFNQICNEEFPHDLIQEINPTQGPMQKISQSEVQDAIRKMKNSK
ncbi:Hypothetical protein SRAE_0000051450 [Strongyloides ratti]|uniref:Uncharacterized protein n=1 Tax=Strongyloides ratti TaxID=34506 RepID=A0A090KV41_STRRB|nr:Hypothetical protein SRAE_0000051450 [Strongyloides ratti]CEF61390.1 Hypothetical protein SRAE_0000051450 [Strongyloides ratti]